MFMHRGEGVGRGRKGRGPIRRLSKSYMDGSFAKIFEVYLEKYKTNELITERGASFMAWVRRSDGLLTVTWLKTDHFLLKNRRLLN